MKEEEERLEKIKEEEEQKENEAKMAKMTPEEREEFKEELEHHHEHEKNKLIRHKPHECDFDPKNTNPAASCRNKHPPKPTYEPYDVERPINAATLPDSTPHYSLPNPYNPAPPSNSTASLAQYNP